jgi:GAF domain-containing protein
MARSKRLDRDKSKQKRLRELEFLMRSSRLINSTLNFNRLLDRIMKIVQDALNVETVSILFLNEKEESMVFEIARGKRDRKLRGLKVPLGEGVIGWVAKNRKPAIVNDLKKDKRYSRHLEKIIGLETRSIMSIPLMRVNRLIGVIEAVNRRGKDPFTQEDLDLFLSLGDHISFAIENARLYRDAERKRLENAQLYRIGVAMGKSLTLDEVLRVILSGLKKLIHYDAASIFVTDRRAPKTGCA